MKYERPQDSKSEDSPRSSLSRLDKSKEGTESVTRGIAGRSNNVGAVRVRWNLTDMPRFETAGKCTSTSQGLGRGEVQANCSQHLHNTSTYEIRGLAREEK